MIQLYAIHKTLTLDPKIQTGLKVRGWKKIFHENGNQKRSQVALLISDNIDFKTKVVIGDKEELYYLLLKKSVHQEYVTIIKTDTSTAEPKHI